MPTQLEQALLAQTAGEISGQQLITLVLQVGLQVSRILSREGFPGRRPEEDALILKLALQLRQERILEAIVQRHSDEHRGQEQDRGHRGIEIPEESGTEDLQSTHLYPTPRMVAMTLPDSPSFLRSELM